MLREELVEICGRAFQKLILKFYIVILIKNSSIPRIFSLHLSGAASILGAINFSVSMKGLFLDCLVDKTYRKDRSKIFCHRYLIQL